MKHTLTRRYMAKILPIRRKTPIQSSINQYNAQRLCRGKKYFVLCYFSQTMNVIFDGHLQSLNNSHDTAVGPDQIHYQMLKHLQRKSKEYLPQIFSKVLKSGYFPLSWSHEKVLPIRKPEKNNNNPYKYRPIASTSCFYKM